MTSLLLYVLLLGNTDASAEKLPPPKDCKSERIALLRDIQPVFVRYTVAPNEIRADNNPRTVQFFIDTDITLDEAYVSRDGQVIHLPVAAADGPDADETVGANLLAQALDRILALKTGAPCPLLKSLEKPKMRACAFIGEAHGTEVVLGDIGFPMPMGIYGSPTNKTYNWCLNVPQPKGPLYLLCHSKPHGPETVYYERSEDFYYGCKTGCQGAARQFFQVCNWPSEPGT